MIVWNKEHQALRDTLAPHFDVLNEAHVERDARAEFSWEKWKALQDTGLFGLPFEERYGGLGQELPTVVYVLEEFGRGCRDAGLGFSLSTHLVSTGVPLQRFGSVELRERYLPSVCSGDRIGAHAITESESGSDALAMRTTARRSDDDFVLNGAKCFVSNGPVAGLFVVYAKTHAGGGPLGVTAFLVERDTPGLSVSKAAAKMGLRTSPLSELYLDDCRVPASNVIGRPGQGYRVFDHVMRWEVLCSFALTAGAMADRLARCLAYARTRQQFGRPIGSYQGTANRLVEMEIGLKTARKWLYDTAESEAAGRDVTADLAATKLVISEQNLASALTAVQLFGGNGFMTEYGLEKDLRDAVGGTIYSGTSQIQRNRIASTLGL
jgi:L-prolyl-PCP dehydrogenase